MTIDRLREALSAIGPPPDARELSEMLWLACHISPPERQEPSHPPDVPRTVEEPAEPTTPGPPAPAVPSPPSAPLTRVHPHRGPTDAPVGEASEVLLPTAPMLADPLGVQRALRPLKRRVPSRHRFELDEDATAARIADTRMWTPVLVPAAERWLTLSLVVDTGPTMRLWQPLARELAEVLLRQGAFQDVHLSHLDTTGRVFSAPGAPLQDPGTLLDASGRHAVLVLSDCSGPHWWDGRAAQAVRRWARTGPTAILQPLAERLWRRTAAPAVPGLAALPRPAAPNTDLRFTPYDGPEGNGLPVPVLEVAPRWFGTWARLVSASGPQPTAVATFPAHPSGTAPLRRERELPIAERVRRFLTTASPDAAELAAHVAVSVPSLPVMRLIQHRILGGSGPGQLAEVLLSGLLRPVGGVRYEFVPGAREALLDTLPRPEALHTRSVLEAVSAEIERRAGTSADRFRALLPTDGGPITLTTDTDHFALLTPKTRSHLAPSPPLPTLDLLPLLGAPVEELLGDNWSHGPPRPVPLGVDGNGETVWLDVLGSAGDAQHGTILGSAPARHEMLKTLILSLAVSHSPNRVAFALFNCSDFYESQPQVGLDRLPHTVVKDPMELVSDSGTMSRLTNELWRRAATLREAGVRTWGDYQKAIADGRELSPLPALVIILGMDGRSTKVDLGLKDRVTQLSSEASGQGIIFIFYLKETPAEIEHLDDPSGWEVHFTGSSDGAHATLRTRRRTTRFRPVRIDSEATDWLLLQMSDREPSAVMPELEPVTASNIDVLMLNGSGTSGMFEGTWAQPTSTPRHPAIGYSRDGNVVTLDSLDVSAEISHGLIAGETEARQRIVRAITLAVAAVYSPPDVTFAFAGLGEHPLGEPLDLPHVRYSEEELLGRPDALQQFIEYFSNSRVNVKSPESLPRLLIVVDISLTFPSSRREVGEMLLSLAQRGKSRGIQLILTSSMVENTTMWNRFLPYLDWRIAAGGLAPAELQRVLKRASLPFPDSRTAYLLAKGDAPRRFSVTHAPPDAVINDFVHRTNESQTTRTENASTALPLDENVEDEAEAVTALSPVDRHVFIQGSDRNEMVRTAHMYGRMLQTLGAVANGNVHEVPRYRDTVGRAPDLATQLHSLFRRSRGGVLLFDLNELAHDLDDGLDPQLPGVIRRLMEEHGDDPVVVFCGDADRLLALRESDPFFATRFRTIVDFGETPSPSEPSADTSGADPPTSAHVGQSPAVTDARIPIGFESGTRERVFADFGTDRHLLISGPHGTGKRFVTRMIIEQLAARPDPDHGAKALIYVLDGQGNLCKPSRVELWERLGIHHSSSPDDFGQLLNKAIQNAKVREFDDTRPEVYLFVADRRRFLSQDPLAQILPELRTLHEHGLHLILTRRLISFGDPPDPVVAAMREFGTPVLLTSEASGQEVDLWDVPPSLRGALPEGLALLAHPGRRRYIRLLGPADYIGSDGP
ncbi:hypothetical protein GCM10022254_03650 [Actinomadura meridiana]|uniref:FtsK domain-containing protein n=1 Tax=Actinomadura meridiana TaxID=559626 RepID=A0ABP8BS06_9ACTN